MSFESNQPETSSESNLQSEPEKNDVQDNEKSKRTPDPLEYVKIGIDCYNGAILVIKFSLIIFLLINYFIVHPTSTTIFYNIICWIYLTGFPTFSIILAILGFIIIQSYKPIVWLIILLIMLVAATNIVKSMKYFCKAPSIIYPEAKSTIIFSWVLWFTAVLLLITGYLLKETLNPIYTLTCTLSFLFFGISECIFLNFLSLIGKYCLPQKNGCPATIIIIAISYFIMILGIINTSVPSENLNSNITPLTDNHFSELLVLGRFFWVLGFLIYIRYIDKLDKFFK
ncbi:MAG: hypothetical protein IKT98_08420, partial [Selenomonadaceae bacterium]|nr:hypothetical protein [Selenomonadaceae bacterium]